MKSHLSVIYIGLVLVFGVLLWPLHALSAVLPEPTPATAAQGSQDGTELAQPTNQIIVKYRAEALATGAFSPTDTMQMQKLSDVAGVPLAYFREMSGDAHVLRLPARLPLAEVQALADRLSALPEVEYAEPDAIMVHTFTPNDPRYAEQWHYLAPGGDHYGINAPDAWDITTGSASTVVAVIDTGITNHSELNDRIVPGYDFISDTWTANDGDGRDNDPADPGDWIAANDCYAGSPARNSSWHGTHVAGTIGAASNNGNGVAGINWNARILPVRVLGKCGGTISDIADGMRWAAGLSVTGAPGNPNPAKVLNLSLGGQGTCSSTYQNAINAIITAGATVIVSAGNNNTNASDFRPGNCNGVITVAATKRNGSRAYYSNYGAVIEISAPGGETNPTSTNGVLSTLNSGTQGPASESYAFYQGTSMAAPHVAGVASLLYARDPMLTPAQVLNILQSTATAFPSGSTCDTSRCGSGIVNARQALEALAPNPTPTINSLSPSSATAGGPGFTLTVNGADFVNGAVVRWNGANRPTTFVNTGQLTAAISAADIATAGTVNVTVFNPAPGGGASNAATFTINNPVPTITSLSPPWIAPGGPSFTLTVNGTNFVNGAVVRWNGANQTTTFVNAGQLTAAIPAADIATAGTVNVTVFNPAPGGGTSDPAVFTVGNPVPTIASLNPPWIAPGGPGFTLTVNGTNFVNGAVVRWNGANQTTTFINPGQLAAAIPATNIAATGTATVTVFNPPPLGGISAPRSFLIGAPRKTYLPIIYKNFPSLPGAPTLNPIDNADGDGNYTVSWTAAANATAYTLQEDDNNGFTSPTTVYNGSATSWSASGKPAGTYFYRVQGGNAWGVGPWSNTQSTTVNPASGWTTIVGADFEGDWPGPWRVYDSDGLTDGEYTWGKRNCRVYEGNYSGWSVGGGTNGAGLACGSNYPDNARAAMDYGPFSLVGATAAELGFKTWLNTEEYFFDYVGAFASINGTDFYGTIWSGNSERWIDAILDLSDVYTLGNLLGQSNVWIRLRFRSDDSVTYSEGAYVDNVVLRKCTTGACSVSTAVPLPAGSRVIEHRMAESDIP